MAQKRIHLVVRGRVQGVFFRASAQREARQLGLTGYVKNRRLDRVRAELADAVPNSGVGVTDIATRWGFTHLGRFAAIYRARFGESPSETLRS